MTTTNEAMTVGKEVVCYCTRCKMDLGHTIMAMNGATPARVICRTCKSEHNFKPKKGLNEPGQKPAAAKKRVSKKEKETVPVETEWLNQLNASTKPAKDYGTDQAFQQGDRVSHPTFGEGIVQTLVFPNKVEVLFKMDIKTLIHAPKHAS